jgi:DinB superfamily
MEFQTSPDRWSVGETAEHIMLAEARLFAGAQRALAAPPNPDWEAKTRGKTEFLEKVLVDRSHKAQAPEPIQPHAQLSREEVIARYKQGRARTLKFIQETDAPLKEHTTDHPFPIFGTLNAYQWIIYIPLHNLRHNQQIAEVKASAGFPH